MGGFPVSATASAKISSTISAEGGSISGKVSGDGSGVFLAFTQVTLRAQASEALHLTKRFASTDLGGTLPITTQDLVTGGYFDIFVQQVVKSQGGGGSKTFSYSWSVNGAPLPGQTIDKPLLHGPPEPRSPETVEPVHDDNRDDDYFVDTPGTSSTLITGSYLTTPFIAPVVAGDSGDTRPPRIILP